MVFQLLSLLYVVRPLLLVIIRYSIEFGQCSTSFSPVSVRSVLNCVQLVFVLCSMSFGLLVGFGHEQCSTFSCLWHFCYMSFDLQLLYVVQSCVLALTYSDCSVLCLAFKCIRPLTESDCSVFNVICCIKVMIPSQSNQAFITRIHLKENKYSCNQHCVRKKHVLHFTMCCKM